MTALQGWLGTAEPLFLPPRPQLGFGLSGVLYWLKSEPINYCCDVTHKKIPKRESG